MWVKALFSSNDPSTDSVIVAGLLSLIALNGFEAYEIVFKAFTFNPTEYAIASGGLIAAIAGGKRLRDGITPSA